MTSEHFDQYVDIICLRLLKVSYEYFLQNPQSLNQLLLKISACHMQTGDITNSNHMASSPSTNEVTIWDMLDGTKYKKLGLNKVRPCPHMHRKWYNQKLSDWRVGMWLFIFGNYTVPIGNGEHCRNGRITRFKFSLGRLELLFISKWMSGQSRGSYLVELVNYQNTLDNLRFISCSQVRMEPLPFWEILGTYDSQVWILIVLTMISVAVTHGYFGRKGSFSSNMLAVFKIYVGQGGPFTDHVFSTPSLRCVTLTMLFMGIVLSEGYKSSNVYNMVTPRKPVSFQTFSEIVKANFTIYTRVGAIRFYLAWPVNAATAKYYVYENHIIASTPRVLHISSEFLHNYHFQKNRVMGNLIKNHSAFHPLLYSYAKRTAIGHKQWFDTDYNKSDDVVANHSRVLHEMMIKWEEGEMIKFLQGCNKAAVILPGYVCKDYAKHLNVSRRDQLSIGKETYPIFSSGVILQGLIPPVILNRIKGIEVSGIWKFMEEVALRRPDFSSRPKKPMKVGMDGNVVVIFFTLSAGCVSALVVFLSEYIFGLLSESSSRTAHQRYLREATSPSLQNTWSELSSILITIADLVQTQFGLMRLENVKRA